MASQNHCYFMRVIERMNPGFKKYPQEMSERIGALTKLYGKEIKRVIKHHLWWKETGTAPVQIANKYSFRGLKQHYELEIYKRPVIPNPFLDLRSILNVLPFVRGVYNS